MRTYSLSYNKKNTLWQSLIPHRSRMFLQELLRRRLPITLQVPERLGLSELSMSLKSDFELSSEIGNLKIIIEILLVWKW